jgi:hypothetical protein
MKGLRVAAVVLTGLLPFVYGKELQPDDGVSAFYDTGAVHEQLMAKKMVSNSLKLLSW